MKYAKGFFFNKVQRACKKATLFFFQMWTVVHCYNACGNPEGQLDARSGE